MSAQEYTIRFKTSMLGEVEIHCISKGVYEAARKPPFPKPKATEKEKDGWWRLRLGTDRSAILKYGNYYIIAYQPALDKNTNPRLYSIDRDQEIYLSNKPESNSGVNG